MYHIQDRDDYKKYNKLCGLVTKSVNVIKRLDAEDPVRIDLTDQLLDKYETHSCHLRVTLQHEKVHPAVVTSKASTGVLVAQGRQASEKCGNLRIITWDPWHIAEC